MKARILFFLLPGGIAAGFAALLVDAGVKSGLLLLLAAGRLSCRASIFFVKVSPYHCSYSYHP